MQYMIVVRNEFNDWTTSRTETARYIGGTPAENTFDAEAEANILGQQLTVTFDRDCKTSNDPEDCEPFEYDVREIDEYA